MKPSKEVSIGLIRTLLARPPRVVDMINAALKDLDLSLETVLQQHGSRLMYLNLRDVRSYEELDQQTYAIAKSEIEETVKFLPQEYLGFAKTFLELGDLERYCLSRSDPESRPRPQSSSAKEIGAALGSPPCDSGEVKRFYADYLERVRASLVRIREDWSWAYEFTKSLVALHYYRYLKNAELLKLGTEGFGKFVEALRLNPLSELLLGKAVDSLSRVDKARLSKYTIYEAAEALSMATHMLFHREGLVDLLTVFLATKYYEPKVARYAFIPKVLRRW